MTTVTNIEVSATSGIDHPALLSEEATAARASADSTIEDSFVDVSNNTTPPSAVPVQPHPTGASQGLDADDLAAKLTAHIAQIEAERIAHTAATDELIKSLRAEIATKATGLEASIRETQAQQNALTAKEVAYQLLGTEDNKLAQECKRLEVAIVENIFRGFFTEVFNFFKEVLKSMRLILVILVILALLAAVTIITIELALKMDEKNLPFTRHNVLNFARGCFSYPDVPGCTWDVESKWGAASRWMTTTRM